MRTSSVDARRVCLNSAFQHKCSSLNAEKQWSNGDYFRETDRVARTWHVLGKRSASIKAEFQLWTSVCVGGGEWVWRGGGNPPKVKPKLSAKFLQCCGLCAINKGRTEFSSNCATQPGPFWTLLAPCHQNQVLLNGNAERCIKSWQNTDQDCDNRVTSQAGTDGELREKLARARCLRGWLAQRKGRGLCALVRNPGSSHSF